LQGALVDHLAVAAHGDFCALGGRALIVQPVGDGLALSDNAEARRRGNRNAAVAFVLAPGDQRVNRRGKSKCRVRRGLAEAGRIP